jgi:glycosyltransferase involved in cell wall biosynthesis
LNGKKIMLVSNSAWNLYNFRLPLIKHLVQLGYKITLACPKDQYFSHLSTFPGVKLVEIHYLHPTSSNPLRAIILLREFIKTYKSEQPNLVLHFTIKPNILGSIAAKIAKVKSISIITGLGFTYLKGGFFGLAIPFMYKIAFRKIERLIVYNPDDLTFFINNRIFPKNSIKLINGSGVDTIHFGHLPKNRPSSSFVFLFIGRLIADKGIREFIEAARLVKNKYPNAAFWLMGGLGNNPASIQEKELAAWKNEGIIAHFGHVDDVRTIIRNADVVVLPSYREGVPKAILEAMAMGKPILTTDVAGCRETVDDGENGWLVPAKDSVAMSAAMEMFLASDNETMLAMGKKSREKALKIFDERIIIQAYMDNIEAVLHGA